MSFCFISPWTQGLSRLHFHWDSPNNQASLWPSPGAVRARSGTWARHSPRPGRSEKTKAKTPSPKIKKPISATTGLRQTKAALLRTRLAKPGGVSLTEMMRVTGWQAGAYFARGLHRAAQDRSDTQPLRGRGCSRRRGQGLPHGPARRTVTDPSGWRLPALAFDRSFTLRSRELCPKVGDGVIRRLCFRA